VMALTRNFKDIMRARVRSDPAFRSALLTEAVNAFLTGVIDTGKAVLRDFIKATVGFEVLAAQTGRPSKRLVRIFSQGGNSAADYLFSIISTLQRASGVTLKGRAARAKGPR
jgi:DNA-binding phage protein